MVDIKKIFIIFYDVLEEATIRVIGAGQLVAGSNALKSIDADANGIGQLLAGSFAAKNIIAELNNSTDSTSAVETLKMALLRSNATGLLATATESIGAAHSTVVISTEVATLVFARKDAFLRSDGSSDIAALSEVVKTAIANIESTMIVSSSLNAAKASRINATTDVDIAINSIATKTTEAIVEGSGDINAMPGSLRRTASRFETESSTNSVTAGVKSPSIEAISKNEIQTATNMLKSGGAQLTGEGNLTANSLSDRVAFSIMNSNGEVQSFAFGNKSIEAYVSSNDPSVFVSADVFKIVNGLINNFSGAVATSDAIKNAFVLAVAQGVIDGIAGSLKLANLKIHGLSNLRSDSVAIKTSINESSTNSTVSSSSSMLVVSAAHLANEGLANFAGNVVKEALLVAAGQSLISAFTEAIRLVAAEATIDNKIIAESSSIKSSATLLSTEIEIQSSNTKNSAANSTNSGQGSIAIETSVDKVADASLLGIGGIDAAVAVAKIIEALVFTSSLLDSENSVEKIAQIENTANSLLKNAVAGLRRITSDLQARGSVEGENFALKSAAIDAAGRVEQNSNPYSKKNADTNVNNVANDLNGLAEIVKNLLTPLQSSGNIESNVSVEKNALSGTEGQSSIESNSISLKLSRALLSLQTEYLGQAGMLKQSELQTMISAALENYANAIKAIDGNLSANGTIEANTIASKNTSSNITGQSKQENQIFKNANSSSDIINTSSNLNSIALSFRNLISALIGNGTIRSNSESLKNIAALNTSSGVITTNSGASKDAMSLTNGSSSSENEGVVSKKTSASLNVGESNVQNFIEIYKNIFSLVSSINRANSEASAVKISNITDIANGSIDAASSVIKNLQLSLSTESDLNSNPSVLKSIESMMINFSELRNEIYSLKTPVANLEATSEIAAQNYKEVAASNLMMSIASIATIISSLLQVKVTADNRFELNVQISSDKNSSSSYDAEGSTSSIATIVKSANLETNASGSILITAESILKFQSLVSALTQLSCLTEATKEAKFQSIGQSIINNENSKEATASTQENAISSLKGTAYDTKTTIEIMAFSPVESGITVLWKESNVSDPVSANGDPIGAILDHRNGLRVAYQDTAANKPIWNDVKKGFQFSDSTDRISIEIPQNFTGKIIESISNGTVVLGVDITAGTWNGYTGTSGQLTTVRRAETTRALLFCRDTTNVFIQSKLDEIASKGATIEFTYPGPTKSLAGFWAFRTEITDFPLINTTSVTNLNNVWDNCANIGLGISNWQFPAIDTSEVTGMQQTWRNCVQIKRFPFIDTRKCTSFSSTWINCTRLGEGDATWEFPLIDTNATLAANQSTAVILQNTWQGCSQIKRFPLIITGKVTNFNSTWNGCTRLGEGDATWEFPLINTSNATSLASTWQGCSNLGRFPLIDTSKVDTVGVGGFNNTWLNCSSLGLNDPNWTFPAIDTSTGKRFITTWNGCSQIKAFSFPDGFGSVETGTAESLTTGFYKTWYDCTNLATFPANVFDTCGCINYYQAFNNCALSQASVDNILISIADAAATLDLSNGRLDIAGGTSSAPSGAGSNAKTALELRGWTVNTN